MTYRVPTIELLTTSFLDTDISKTVPEADLELKSRGWPKWCISFVRFLLSFSLWTNGFIWEEWSLGWFDVFSGYALTFFIFGIFCLLLSSILGSLVFKIGILFLAYVVIFLVFVIVDVLVRSKDSE